MVLPRSLVLRELVTDAVRPHGRITTLIAQEDGCTCENAGGKVKRRHVSVHPDTWAWTETRARAWKGGHSGVL